MVKKLLLYRGFILFFFFFWAAMTFGQECPSSVSISAEPSANFCEGTPITFTASQTGGTPPFTYQWKLKSGIVGSTNQYILNNPQQGEQVTVTITDANGTSCTVSKTFPTLSVNPLRTPEVSITINDNSVCLEDNVIFTANPISGGSDPIYTWYLNGSSTPAQTGASAIFSTTTLGEGDNSVRVEMTSSLSCVTVEKVSAESGVVTVIPDATITSPTNADQTKCINTSIGSISFTVGGAATGATVTGLPPGVTGSLSGKVLTISGSPTESGEFPYTVSTTGNCKQTSATGTLTITPDTSIALESGDDTQTICASENIEPIIYSLNDNGTGATVSGLPSDFTKTFSSGKFTISGSSATPGTYNYTITAEGPCEGESMTGTIVIEENLLPSVTISSDDADNTICQGTSVTFTATPTNGGTAPAYQWKINNADVGTNSPTFTTTKLSDDQKVTVVLSSSESCLTVDSVTSEAITMTVLDNLTPAVSISSDLGSTICQGTSVEFTATPTHGGSDPTYQWMINGSPVSGATNSIFSSADLADNDKVSVEMISNEACLTTPTASSEPITMTVNPKLTPSVLISSSDGDNIICAGASVTFTADVTNGGASPTFEWKVDGTPAGGTGTKTFITTGLTDGQKVSVTVTSNETCLATGVADSNVIEVQVDSPISGLTPEFDDTDPAHNPTAICPVVSGLVYTVKEIPGASSYVWDVPNGWSISGGENTNSITVTAGNTAIGGDITVYGRNECGNSGSTALNVSVGTFTYANAGEDRTVCLGTSSIVMDGEVGGAINNHNDYSWTDNGANGKFVISGNKELTATYELPSSIRNSGGTVRITLSTIDPDGDCPSATDEMTITVLKKATITTADKLIQEVCINTSIDNIEIEVGEAGTSASVTGLPAGIEGVYGEGIFNISGTPTEAGSFPFTVTTGGDCTSLQSSLSGTITVFPDPTVADIEPIEVCAGTTLSSTEFSGGVDGTTFTWTSSNSAVGLAITGEGNLPSFVAENSTSEPITSEITVTPKANGCTGTSKSFTITVNPTATFSIPEEIKEVELCDQEITAAISFGGSTVSGTSFKWSNDNTEIGLSAGGADEIPAFTAVNSGNGPITANITVTPVANGCDGTPQTFKITVNPTPTVLKPGTDPVVCNGETVSAIAFSGNEVPEFSYEWSIDKNIGLETSSGTGSIPEFTANNTTNEPIIANVTVTPIAKECSGTPQTYTITVNPTPTAIVPEDIEVCHGESVSDIIFSGNVTGTSFNWTNNNESIGLSASGTDKIPAFTASNLTSDTITATITVTPTANNCAGPEKTFNLIVYPQPTVEVGEDQIICSNSSPSITAVLGGGATSGTWTSSGSGTFGDPNLAATTYTPSSNDVTAGSVILTYTSEDPAGPCEPAADSFVLTINKLIVITTEPLNKTVCSTQDATFEVIATGDIVSYEWYLNGNPVPDSNSATLLIDQATLEDAGSYTVKILGKDECEIATSEPAILSVDENIVIEPFDGTLPPGQASNGQPLGGSYCTGSDITLSVNASANGAELHYQWMDPNNEIVGLDSPELVLTNAQPEQSGNYHVIITGPDSFTCDTATSANANILISSPPEITTMGNELEICSNGSINITSGVEIINYTSSVLWTVSEVSGSIANPTSLTEAIFTPAPGFSGAAEVTLTVYGEEGCSESTATDSRTITVVPLPEITEFSYTEFKEDTSAEYCETDLVEYSPHIDGSNLSTGTGVYSVEPVVENGLNVHPTTGKFTPNGTAPGVYIVKYTFEAASGTGACDPVSKEFTVTIGEKPLADFTYGEVAVFCSDDENPTPETVGAGVLGTFSSSTGVVFVDGGAPGEIDLKKSPKGEHVIINTVDFDGDGCQPVPFQTKIFINIQPNAPVVPDVFYCLNDEDVPGFEATVMDGGTINWYESSDATTTMDSPPVINTNTVKTTSYWVSQTSAEGCESERVEVKATINELPVVTITSEENPGGDDVPICQGSSIVLTGNGATSYTWRANSLESAVIGEEATFSADPDETTTYFVTGTNENNCSSTAEITVIVDSPTIPGTLGEPLSVCETNPSTTLELTGYTGDIVRWEYKRVSATAWTVFDDGDLSSTRAVSGLTEETSYRVYVKNGVCEEEYAETTVSVDPVPIGGALAFDIKLDGDPENDDRIFLTCQRPGENYAVDLYLSGHFGEIVGWKYRTSTGAWSPVQIDGVDFKGTRLTADQIEGLNLAEAVETTIFAVEIKSGACSPNVLSETALFTVIPADIEPKPVTVEPAIICIEDGITLSSTSVYSTDYQKFEGGAFDDAGIKNHGWRFLDEDGNANDFSSAADNGRADHWLRTTPKDKFHTADIYDEVDPKYQTTPTIWDSKEAPAGNDGFAIVSGANESTMETPVFSLNGLDEGILTFDQAYNLTPGAEIRVEISTESGAPGSYTPIFQIFGAATSDHYNTFGDGTPETRPKNKMVLDLGAYSGFPNLRIRFNYIGIRAGDVWAIDNIKVPEGPQDSQLIWYYDDPGTPEIDLDTIGEINQEVVTFTPEYIGWNKFQVQTELILDSHGNTCKSIYNQKDVQVFVFDRYTIETTEAHGTCGSKTVELTTTIAGFKSGPVENFPTKDGFIGRWKITDEAGAPITSGYTLTKLNPDSGIDEAINDPNVLFTAEDLNTYIFTYELIPDEITAVYPEDYYVEELRGTIIAKPDCPIVLDPISVEIKDCTTLDFDGVDDYVELGTGYTAGPYSIEVWIRPFKRFKEDETYTDPTTGTIISGPSFEITMADLTGKVATGDRWYHIALNPNGDLYIDGIFAHNIGTDSGAENETYIGARWNTSSDELDNYFSGWIEEVRIWKGSLSEDEIRFMMNQRIELATSPTASTPINGEVVPVKGVGSYLVDSDGYNQWEEIEGDDEENNKVWYKRTWGSLAGYYRLISEEPDPLNYLIFDDSQKPANGVTPNFAAPDNPGKLHNMETHQQNTSPTPYVSYLDETVDSSKPWKEKNTWLRPEVWDYPNSTSNGSTILWNIAKVRDNIHSGPNDIWMLGLLVESGELEIQNSTTEATPHWADPGQMLRVTHYLNLQGVIDLNGESQLLQNSGSIIAPDSKGSIEVDQQGTASSYNYNYWTSPVSTGFRHLDYTIEGVMKDGTTPVPVDLDFGYAYGYADGTPTTPRKVSSYWLYKHHGDTYYYAQWHYVGEDGPVGVGEGYSMKGTDGYSAIEDRQNYTFKGLPNNGDFSLTLGANQGYLTGNPFPSALDARQFILDHLDKDLVTGATNDKNVFNGTLLFWSHFAGHSHNLEQYVGGYAPYNLSGGTAPYSADDRIDNSDPEAEGKLIPGDFIPVGQAFVMNTKIDSTVTFEGDIAGGEIKFKNSQRIYYKESDPGGESVFLSQESISKAEKAKLENRQKIWLNFKSPEGYYRQLLITADPLTTNNFDIGYDSPLVENNKEDMYWIFENSNYVIQGVPHFNEDQEFQLGVKVKKEDKFTISINDLKNFPEDKPIYLKDSLLNIYHNLKKGPYETTAPVGATDNRFKIVFRLQENPDPDEEVEVPDEGDEVAEENEDIEDMTGIKLMYLTTDREILIRNPQLVGIQEMVLNNLLGQKVHEFFELPLQEEVYLPVRRLSSGVYVVKLKTDKGMFTEKIILE